MSALTFGSLFAGIGGIDLGFESAGMECKWQVEKDEFCLRVLEKHWPDVTRYTDITELDTDDLERVDVIAGGFPCQPVSLVGRGLAQDDPRWLWPHYARIVRALRPSYVVVENVPGLLVRGFGDVLGDLAEIGYDTEWDCIPAAAVGAPHLRYRVFVVAYAGCARRRQDAGSTPEDEGQHARRSAQGNHVVGGEGESRREGTDPDADSGRREELTSGDGATGALDRPRRDDAYRLCDDVPDAGCIGPQGSQQAGSTPRISGGEGEVLHADGRLGERQFEWESLWRSRPSLASGWTAEPDVGRVAHGIPKRVDRLRSLGNAVVPQVAEFIGGLVVEHAGRAA